MSAGSAPSVKVHGGLYFQWLIASRSTNGKGDANIRFITAQTLDAAVTAGSAVFPTIYAATDPENAHNAFVAAARADGSTLVFSDAAQYGTAVTWVTNTWISALIAGTEPTTAPVLAVVDKLEREDLLALGNLLVVSARDDLGRIELGNEVITLVGEARTPVESPPEVPVEPVEPAVSSDMKLLQSDLRELNNRLEVYERILGVIAAYTGTMEDLGPVIFSDVKRKVGRGMAIDEATWEPVEDDAIDGNLEKLIALMGGTLPSGLPLERHKEQFHRRNFGKTEPKLHVLGKAGPHPAVIAAFKGKDHQTALLKKLGLLQATTSESQGYKRTVVEGFI